MLCWRKLRRSKGELEKFYDQHFTDSYDQHFTDSYDQLFTDSYKVFRRSCAAKRFTRILISYLPQVLRSRA
jgi:hypothetical protein